MAQYNFQSSHGPWGHINMDLQPHLAERVCFPKISRLKLNDVNLFMPDIYPLSVLLHHENQLDIIT